MTLNSSTALRSALWYGKGVRFEDDITRVQIVKDGDATTAAGGMSAGQDLVVRFTYAADEAPDTGVFRVGVQSAGAWTNGIYYSVARDLVANPSTFEGGSGVGNFAFVKADDENVAGVGTFTMKLENGEALDGALDLVVDLQSGSPVTLYDVKVSFDGTNL